MIFLNVVSPTTARAYPDDTTELNGTWQVLTTVFDGVDVPPEKIKDRQMIFEGDRLIPIVGKERKKPIAISFDLSKSPRHINIKNPG